MMEDGDRIREGVEYFMPCLQTQWDDNLSIQIIKRVLRPLIGLWTDQTSLPALAGGF